MAAGHLRHGREHRRKVRFLRWRFSPQYRHLEAWDGLARGG